MQASNSFKRVFLKKLLVGLQHDDFSSENMSLTERKNAIKLSSDVALAFAGHGAIWSQALITDVTKQEKNKTLARHILGDEFERMTKKPCGRSVACKMVRSKKILKRSYIRHRIRKSAPRRMIASAIAKRMVMKRTQVLKCIIPGGESMDGFSLLDETVDYILSLRVQVDVMRRLANVFEHSILKNASMEEMRMTHFKFKENMSKCNMKSNSNACLLKHHHMGMCSCLHCTYLVKTWWMASRKLLVMGKGQTLDPCRLELCKEMGDTHTWFDACES